ncbi:hypothetical protein IWX50DRAFT_616270 [Phyllosticta citricarpa]
MKRRVSRLHKADSRLDTDCLRGFPNSTPSRDSRLASLPVQRLDHVPKAAAAHSQRQGMTVRFSRDVFIFGGERGDASPPSCPQTGGVHVPVFLHGEDFKTFLRRPESNAPSPSGSVSVFWLPGYPNPEINAKVSAVIESRVKRLEIFGAKVHRALEACEEEMKQSHNNTPDLQMKHDAITAQLAKIIEAGENFLVIQAQIDAEIAAMREQANSE